jgi:rhodanese-related sulfurtransferase
MQNKKAIIFLLIPIFFILILVIIKSLDQNNFSLDIKETLEQSVNQEHGLNLNQIREKLKNPDKVAIIDIRNPDEFTISHLKNASNVPFAEILSNSEIINLKSTDNDIILYSSSLIESTKAWIILTEMGYQKLFLLDIPADLISDNIFEEDTLLIANEILKYKFQPDTLSELE